MKSGFPFKFWTHKILPLVYDDSLSYYEFLCKIAKIVNDISEHNEEQDTAISENNANISRVENEVKNDIVPQLEREISSISNNLTNYLRILSNRIGVQVYEPTAEYYSGDYCLYYNENASEDETIKMGQLYRCENYTTGSFDDSKWSATSITSEIRKNSLMLTNLISNIGINYNENLNYIVGSYCIHEGNLFKCVAQTTGEFDNASWVRVNIATELQNLWGSFTNLSGAVSNIDTDLQNVKVNIASEYQEYSGTPLFYPKGSIVWYNNSLYLANTDVTVDSTSVLPPSENASWEFTNIAENLEGGGTDFDATIIAPEYDATETYKMFDLVTRNDKLYSCLITGTTGEWDDSKWEMAYASYVFAPIVKTETNIARIQGTLGVYMKLSTPRNVPKYTLGYDNNGIVYYALRDTTAGEGEINYNDWDRVDNLPNALFDWVQMLISGVDRYSEVLTYPIVANITAGE